MLLTSEERAPKQEVALCVTLISCNPVTFKVFLLSTRWDWCSTEHPKALLGPGLHICWCSHTHGTGLYQTASNGTQLLFSTKSLGSHLCIPVQWCKDCIQDRDVLIPVVCLWKVNGITDGVTSALMLPPWNWNSRRFLVKGDALEHQWKQFAITLAMYYVFC